MTTVVNLSEYRRKNRREEGLPAGGATIHLFLGVRYERHVEIESPVRPQRGGRGKSRKRA